MLRWYSSTCRLTQHGMAGDVQGAFSSGICMLLHSTSSDLQRQIEPCDSRPIVDEHCRRSPEIASCLHFASLELPCCCESMMRREHRFSNEDCEMIMIFHSSSKF